MRSLQIFGTSLLALNLLALSGCGGGGGGGASEPPAPIEPPGLSSTPAVSASGSLSLEQYNRDARSAAPVSVSTLYTLVPEGATP